ncbi:MAG: hypothetical protein ACREBD_11340 [Blastocatellia bacterium]
MPQRIDDQSIKDEDLLWRRIVNTPVWIKQNSDGTYRPSSAAFLDDYTGEVSVHLAKLTTQEQALAGCPDEGLVEFEATIPRFLGHAVVRDPTDADPSHTLICPPSNQTRKTRKQDARKMADAARWLVKPMAIRS